jgi:hypothetical protein
MQLLGTASLPRQVVRLAVALVLLVATSGYVALDADQAAAASRRTVHGWETDRSTFGWTILRLDTWTTWGYTGSSFTSLYDSYATCTGGNGWTFNRWYSYRPLAFSSSAYKRSYYHCETKYDIYFVTQYADDDDGFRVYPNGRWSNYT